MGLFGTSGIRGDAEKLFTNQFCFDIGRTFAQFLEQHNTLGPIAIGMDSRPSSPRIRDGLFKGLATGGIELFDEGICPIPAINWILKAAPVSASLMITGSHINTKLNGVKFYAFEEEITKEHEEEIENSYRTLKKQRQNIPTEEPEVHQESRAQELYIEMLAGLITENLPSWKVVVDCANGAQSVVIPSLLTRLGLTVVRVNCEPQQELIARDTDTDDKAVIEKLKETVVREKADFGIAYDGDGDRVVFIDEKGNFIQGEYSCSLVAKYSDTSVVVTPISSSQVVDTIGKKVIRTKVGSPYVVAGMKESGATFGFEPNGGAISSEIMYTRDGGSMAIKILRLFAQFEGHFSELIGQLPKFHMKRTKVDCPSELNQKIISAAKQEFKGEKTEELDGLKIWIDNATWILFRPSANAPEFRVFAESTSKEKAEELKEQGISFVQNMIKKLE